MLGRRKPKTIQELPSRYLNLSGAPIPDPERPDKKSSPTFAITIIAAGLTVVGGIVYMAAQNAADNHARPVQIPETTEAHQKIGAVLESVQTYMSNGEYDKARAILAEATRTYVEDQDLRVAYAQTLVALERPGAAYEQIEAALAIGPRPDELEFLAGTIACSAKNLDRALEHFAMAQTADPINPEYPVYLGQVQRQLGLVEKAKASLLRAANLDPENAVAWGTLADIALSQNKTIVAKQHIDRARRIDPDNPEWRIVEARILKRNGEAEQALMILQGLPEEHRMALPQLRLTAECYAMLSRPQDAASLFASAVEAKPRHPEVAFEAALWFERAGDDAAAKSYAERAALLGSDPARQMVERLTAAADGG